MYKPREYQGPMQNYFGDIAILVTQKTFTFNLKVQPVCLDWGQRYNVEFSAPDTISRYVILINKFLNYFLLKKYFQVTGWGYTHETMHLSEVLKEMKVSLVNYDKCRLELPQDFLIYLTSDKICSGFYNESNVVDGVFWDTLEFIV